MMTGIASPALRGMTVPPGGFSPFASLYCVIQLLVALNALPLRMIIGRYTASGSPRANFYERTDWRLDVIAADAALTQQQLELGLINPWLGEGDVTHVDVYPHLRTCPECMEADFHSAFYQCRFVQRCPVHGCQLIDRCPRCDGIRPYNLLSIERQWHPFACPCGKEEWTLMSSVVRQNVSRQDFQEQFLKFLSWSLSARSAVSVAQGSLALSHGVNDRQRVIHSQGGRLEVLATQCAVVRAPALEQGLNLSPGKMTYPVASLFVSEELSRASNGGALRAIKRCSRDAGLSSVRRSVGYAIDGLENYARARHQKCFRLQQALQRRRVLVAEAICEVLRSVAMIREMQWSGKQDEQIRYGEILQDVRDILRAKYPSAQDYAPGIAAILTSSLLVSEITEVVRETKLMGTSYALESAARRKHLGTLTQHSFTLGVDNHPLFPSVSCAISTAGSLSAAWAELCFAEETHVIQSRSLYDAAVRRQENIAKRINDLRPTS